MVKEHECIVLSNDLPEDGLEAGDIGTMVHIHQSVTGEIARVEREIGRLVHKPHGLTPEEVKLVEESVKP